MNVQLLAEQHLEFLSLKGGCRGYTCQNATLLEITCPGSYVTTISDYITCTGNEADGCEILICDKRCWRDQ